LEGEGITRKLLVHDHLDLPYALLVDY
jgi:putative transposase